ncbi:PTS sugar transporter subunit IIB [Desulfovulcanus ferrireducens]|jgi:PTS system mannose-specific IIB component|uniref:PTS sugar transporter subunit IIB n=1 Tax=Desulfovulcanus ferrireducens TaxID=2831190 RepID=UPI00207B9E08|nr:PTS sugar transporter subunit IIB [Desulfovulcanus ferrireducens]
MLWVRIDNRLVHGQVIETWLPYTKARVMIVVNDDLAADPLRQEIVKLAIPQEVEIIFSSIEDSLAYVKNRFESQEGSVFILFATCEDARMAYEKGLDFDSLNVGNLHYGPGKKQVCAHIALSQEDISCLKFFTKKGVKLDFRCVPHKPVQVSEW